ncbi:MAG: DUF3383 family protein [Methanobrevibacter sp.]|nr:DUF3383 family protein [Methanobrevibacter sp.]
MSLPYSAIVPITGVVESPTFATEKKHLLLAVTNELIPTSKPWMEFGGAGAVSEYGAYCGKSGTEYEQLQKYFSFVSKGGNAPEKVVVARWYRENTAAFIKGAKVAESVSSLNAVTDGSLKITIDGTTEDVTGLDFSSDTSYSAIASTIQTALQTDFSGATVAYSSITGGFIITSPTTGSTSSVGAVGDASTGSAVANKLGLKKAELSQGVNAETYAGFCDRIYHANSSGFSISTYETLSESDIVGAVEWLQSNLNGQSYNTRYRLVFNETDKTTAKALASTLEGLGYTGYVICYDPKGEWVNTLDCAICATIDYEVDNGAINFNFQPAVGYTPITTLGTVVDYQQGLTNSSLMEELDASRISCVYSVGFGSQEQVYYGSGLMAGSFGTEATQVDESALEQAVQVTVLNGLTSLNKVPLRGEDATSLISSMLASPIGEFVKNGVIAKGGKLTSTERASVSQATGSANAGDALESVGYYYMIYDLTEADIQARRVRVLLCYLASGAVNKLRIINRVYGA